MRDLIKGWMQSKEFPMAVGLALIFIVSVNLFIGGTIKEMREERVGEGILQVKDAASPATPRGVINRHRPSFKVILQNKDYL